MKVALVGGAKSSKDAPWDDDSWEVWALGNQMQRYKGKRVTRIFEIHENLDEHDSIYPQWLAAHNIPMVVSDKFPIKPDHSIVFDYCAARDLIGENFSSSPAVMMAQAIMDGAEEISIYGVDMALDEHEYFMQRPCMEQWIGYAKGRGIKVFIHPDSPLGYSTYREGRDWPNKGFDGFDDGDYREMYDMHRQHKEALEIQINELQPQLDAKIAEYHARHGAMQTYERLQKLHRAKAGGLDVEMTDGQN